MLPLIHLVLSIVYLRGLLGAILCFFFLLSKLSSFFLPQRVEVVWLLSGVFTKGNPSRDPFCYIFCGMSVSVLYLHGHILHIILSVLDVFIIHMLDIMYSAKSPSISSGN